jgi:hypothetical protein
VHTAAEKKQKVVVHVNEKPVKLSDDRVSGREIKQSAIDQGVEIELDFILVEELKHGETRVIGDDDVIKVNDRSRFNANADDDNS